MDALVTTQSDIKLVAVNNALAFACDNTDCQTLQGADLFDLVRSVYPKGLPLNTYLYHEIWDVACDITPTNDSDIDALKGMSGTFYLVTYPSDPVTIFTVAVSILASIAVTFLLPLPAMSAGGTAPPSPNNSLSQRTNTPRLGARKPDIHGTLIATPDMYAKDYVVFIDNNEVEYGFFSLGVGFYNVLKVFDDTSDMSQIGGTTAQVYNPLQNIALEAPAFEFGASMTSRERVLSKLVVKRYSAANGQVLQSPEKAGISDNLVFVTPNTVVVKDSSMKVYELFKAGDSILITLTNTVAISHKVREGHVNPMSFGLTGVYTIAAISGDTITLNNPSASNSNWTDFASTDDYTIPTYGTIKINTAGVATDPTWAGPFYTDDEQADGVMINFVAPGGIYTVHPDGDKFAPFGVQVEVKTEKLDDAGDPIAGTEQTEFLLLQGRGATLTPDGSQYALTTDDEARKSVGHTQFFYRKGKHRVWVRRYSKENVPNPPQQYFEEIKIKDLYSYRVIVEPEDAATNVTRIYTKTQATDGALSVKERKLRALVQRFEYNWQTTGYKLSNRIDDIIYTIGRISHTGGLSLDDFNMPQISAEVDKQIAYFGTDKCAHFCGTFDNKDITTEEMIQTVAMAGFFTAYRLNNKIHLHFEMGGALPVATFNSHNILPESFEYGESFGARNDYDGVEVTFVDPNNNDVRKILRYPPSGNALNPDKVDLIGVRNEVQAYMHMMRRHWKNQLSFSTCSFTGADESGIVVPTNRINVANQMRADTQQGAIESLDIIGGKTVLTLSSPVDFGSKTEATIFVQTMSATVDNIKCKPTENSYQVVLNRAPSQPLSTDWDAVVRATYQLVLHNDAERDSYIVSTKEPDSSPLSHRLTCINYTDKYYQNDKDYINGLIA